jgi:hypothetical protein
MASGEIDNNVCWGAVGTVHCLFGTQTSNLFFSSKEGKLSPKQTRPDALGDHVDLVL